MYAFEATILSVNQEKFNFTNYKLQQVKALLLSLYLDPTKSGHSYTFIPQSKYRINTVIFTMEYIPTTNKACHNYLG